MAAADPRIIVHGGAGSCPPERREAGRAGCRAAAQRGWQILQAGGSALEAVEAAVIALEDDPEFNAGTGAALNARGEVLARQILIDGRCETAL
jgi:beta-aspartyl-peptidase (threonine type)